MEVTKKDVLETATLLNIAIDETEVEVITKSFIALINYFNILDTVELDINDEDMGDDILRFRDGHTAMDREETTLLIENSEEHEDNYILIPNIL